MSESVLMLPVHLLEPGTIFPPSADAADPSMVRGSGESDLLSTTKVPDHELLRMIGRGAYGQVWLARNAVGTLRAVKFVRRCTFEKADHFEREFKGLQKFEPISRLHEGLVQVLQIGRDDEAGSFYYVMELADGLEPPNAGADVPDHARVGCSEVSASGPGRRATQVGRPDRGYGVLPSDSYTPRTLASDLRARGALPLAECLSIGTRLASALAFLHAQGLVHRDIKPSNIIFVRGQPKLADVGLVTGIGDANSLVGTAGYIPPEGPGSPSADIYSLGKVLYEVAFAKNRQEFPQLPLDLASWPDHHGRLEVNEIVLRACESDPRKRYSSAKELNAELTLLRGGNSVTQARKFQRHRSLAKRLGLAAALMGLLAVGGSTIWRQAHKSRSLSSNPEAERLYQEAVYELKSESLERLQQACANLNQAVALDPRFVDAHYKMLEAYFSCFGHQLPPHFSQAANVRMVADKLRELAPNSAQYHTANSLVKFGEWKFNEAIAEAALAKRRDPRFMRAHMLYGWYVLLVRGDHQQAEKEYGIAERIEPTDEVVQILLAGLYCAKGDFDKAIEKAEHARNLEPRAAGSWFWLTRAYEGKGDYRKALDALEQFEVKCGADPEAAKKKYDQKRDILRTRGERELWESLLEETRQNPSADPYWTARIYAHLGNENEALSLLEEACRRHNGNVHSLLEDHAWEKLRSNQRFVDLLQRVGLRPF